VSVGAGVKADAIATEFEEIGARFVLPVEELSQRLGNCRAVVFDWDGVFNTGQKGMTATTGFNEPDSMGINMLRFGLWRESGALPFTAIISGESNDSAIAFAQREHLSTVYTGVSNKGLVIESVCQDEGISPDQIACVFDDINDLPMAELCGLRLMVRRDSSPLLTRYAKQHSLCDYVSGADSSAHAVREICEMLLGLLSSYDRVLESRVAYDDEYQSYLQQRQAVVTRLVRKEDSGRSQ
jgi:3-deoxy-D-manno-octulosonate 8-phosphate phosphatase (KDO 8-P phosphatase)